MDTTNTDNNKRCDVMTHDHCTHHDRYRTHNTQEEIATTIKLKLLRVHITEPTVENDVLDHENNELAIRNTALAVENVCRLAQHSSDVEHIRRLAKRNAQLAAKIGDIDKHNASINTAVLIAENNNKLLREHITKLTTENSDLKKKNAKLCLIAQRLEDAVRADAFVRRTLGAYITAQRLHI